MAGEDEKPVEDVTTWEPVSLLRSGLEEVFLQQEEDRRWKAEVYTQPVAGLLRRLGVGLSRPQQGRQEGGRGHTTEMEE